MGRQCLHDLGRLLRRNSQRTRDRLRGRQNALFQGVLKPSVLESMLNALLAVGYDGPVAIELAKGLARPLAGLVAARDVLAAWDAARATDPDAHE